MPTSLRLAAALAALLLVATVAAEEPDGKVIDFIALTALIDGGAPHLLIDNRAPDPYAAGHLPTAVSLPGYLFEKDDVPGLPEDRDLPLVVYCNGGHCGISFYVAQRLADYGYTQILIYQDGVKGWLARGQKLVTARHEALPQITAPELVAATAGGARVHLIDVRDDEARAARPIPGAVGIPLVRMIPTNRDLPRTHDGLVVVFGGGRWDGRAYYAADLLRTMGFADVRLFAPGVAGWPAAPAEAP